MLAASGDGSKVVIAGRTGVVSDLFDEHIDPPAPTTFVDPCLDQLH